VDRPAEGWNGRIGFVTEPLAGYDSIHRARSRSCADPSR
jgi:hypothetical protein